MPHFLHLAFANFFFFDTLFTDVCFECLLIIENHRFVLILLLLVEQFNYLIHIVHANIQEFIQLTVVTSKNV